MNIRTLGKLRSGGPWMYYENISEKRPNVIFILADDYGFNDIGYHGSEIQTPQMNKLSSDGIQLENYYVQPRDPRTKTNPS